MTISGISDIGLKSEKNENVKAGGGVCETGKNS
jgi:hypothetical protein